MALLLCIATPALAEMAVGSYTGDGSGARTISGLGFQPRVVIVKGESATAAMIRVSYMAAGASKSLTDAAGVVYDSITGFTADGFTIAGSNEVNANGTTYQWIAFATDPGDMYTGFYNGTGVYGQTFSGIGFQPDMMIVVPHDAERCQFRTIDMPNGQSTTLRDDGLLTNRLLLFVPDGFQVGNDASVNQFGRQYGLIAWRQNSTKFTHGTYTGDGENSQNIAGLSFGPEWLLVKSEASHAAIHRPRSLGNPWSAYFTAQGHIADGITNFSANHFTVGSDPTVNAGGDTYYYAAFNNNNSAADIAVTIGADDAAPDEGQEITLDVTAANNGGPDDATFVTIQVDLPPGLTYTGATPDVGSYDDAMGIWSLGDLAVDASAGLLLTATVDAGTAGQVLTSRVAVEGLGESDPNAANDEATVDVTVNSVDLELAMGVDDPAPELGDLVTLTAAVTNHGPADATDVSLQVDVPADLAVQTVTPDPGATGDFSTPSLIHLVYDIPAGESRQVLATYRVDRGAVSRLFAGRTSSAQSDADTLNNDVDVTLTIPSADLAVSLAAADPTPAAGDTVQLTLGLDNAGPDDAPAPTVTVSLPAGLAVTGATPDSGVFDIPSGVWTPGAVAGGNQLDLVLDVHVAPDQGGQSLAVDAVVTSPRNDPAAANDTASVTLDTGTVSDLAVTASIDPTTAWPGDPATLTIVVANNGPSVAPGPAVTVTLPVDLIHLGHTAEVGTFDPGTEYWDLAGVLQPGASRTLVIDLSVAPAATGSLVCTATAADAVATDPVAANDTGVAVLVVGDAVPVTVTVVPFVATDRTLLPGGVDDDVLRLRVANSGTADVSLAGLTVHNPVTGGGDQATQDGYWSNLALHDENADVLGTGVFSGGVLSFSGLAVDLAGGETRELTLRGAAMLWAPDGVELRPTVEGAGDLVVSGLVDLQGDWPLTAPGTLFVDGMTAAQIALHPVDAEVFQIGSVRNLALDVTLPANGGQPDQLIKLNVTNEGTASYPQVISRVEAWADDGDGLFDAAADLNLADLIWTGGQRFEASSLAVPVGAAGLRVFVTVDVAEDALGGTVRLSLPAGDDVGVGMLSGNDGPIDAPVTNPLAQTVSATDRVIVTTAPLNPQTVAPGSQRVPLLHLVARNLYADERTVRQLRVRNVTVGDAAATQDDLDATIEQLVIQRDGDLDGQLDGPDIDPVVVSTTWENGIANFEGVRWTLAPDEVSHLFVTASVDLVGAADGDELGAMVGGAGDLGFQDITVVVGDWPLDSGARYTVDGMVAAQISCPAVPPVSLTANEGPVLALDLTVPGNGYLDDTLQTLRLANLGTATPSDIGALDLYDDQNGNGIFEPGTDPLLASLAGIGQDWVALDVNLAVPAGGRRLFAGLTVASVPTDSATVRLSVPVDGLDVASTNDGPRDAAVASPTSLLMSTAPLLSNLAFDIAYSTTEMTTTATMHVQNVGGEDVVDIVPLDLMVTGDGSVNLVSGPQPMTLDLAQGASGTFTWLFACQGQGPVFLTARCEGTGAVGGQPRGSLASASAAHVVLDPAVNLELYPVANMPFSINRGQTGVVPMTLTLLNGGGPERADLRLDRLVVTLDDGNGNPVVPADLLSHVSVNEGVNVYCDRANLETSGQTMTLDLGPAVVVTESEPVTLGLRMDIRSDTTVDRFRVILMSANDITVVDNVSGLPRTTQLTGEAFPVMSAAGSIVSQATGLVVAAPVQPELTASAGQLDIELLRLELTSSGDDSASEVKVGGFAVTVTDTLGQALPDASAHLSRMWVEGSLAMHAAHDLTGPADSLVVFELLPQVTVPVGAPSVPLIVHGRLPADPVLGPLRLRLEPTTTFDARDGNNAADVGVTYQPAQITGPIVRVEDPAPPVQLAVAGTLPPVISLGTADVLAMTMTVTHPGPANTAAVRLDSLHLACLDIDRQPQDPDAILDGYRVFWDGEDLGVPVFYDHQQLVIPLGGRELAPLATGVLTLRLDVEAAAPAGGFELVASPTCLTVTDVNLAVMVPVVPAPSYTLPASSGLARLQPPSDDVVAGWTDRLPPLLSTDTTRVEALRLVLTNPAPVGAAPVELSSLTLRAADRRGIRIVAGAVLGGVTVEADGDVWADLADPAVDDSTLALAGAAPLLLPAGSEVELVVKVSGRTGADADGLSLGILEEDVACVQPGSTTPVLVRPAAGQTFPFWTAASGLGAAALAESYINFPNPFAAGRDVTRFAFNLTEAATVSLRIWTPRGESVVTLLSDQPLEVNQYQDFLWDGRNGRGQVVRNGVYVAELKVQYESGGSERLLRKVAVVR